MINWRKSSHSGDGNDDACVELARSADGVWMRDSKAPDGGRLEFERTVFTELLARVKRDEFNL
jgi:hypothetical protein